MHRLMIQATLMSALACPLAAQPAGCKALDHIWQAPSHTYSCDSSPLQDNEDNVTRFMVLAREPLVVYNPEPGAYKTSIVFSMQEGPGQLYKVGGAWRVEWTT